MRQVPPTDYLGVVRRYKTTVAGIVVLLAGLALAASLVEEPSYQATAQILVVPNAGAAVAGAASPSSPTDPVRLLGSEIQLLRGALVHAEVERRLGPTPPISASALADADIIRVKASGGSPARAASIANSYAAAYLDVRTAIAAAAVTAASRPLERQITDLQAQIDQAKGPRRAGLIKAQAVFEKELSQLQVDGAVHSAETRLLSAASAPASPFRPRPVRTVAWALAVGLALGLSAAFYRDYLDDTIKCSDEMSARWPGLPVCGLIPLVTGASGGRPQFAQVYEPRSSAGEAYQSLANLVRSLALDSGGRVLQITSPTGGEGKTTTVANLGATLAQQGRKVAIVGCDLRRPQIQRCFDLGDEIGLTSVITRQVPLNDAICRVVDQPMLIALPGGPVPPNPAELLATGRAAQILQSLKREVDVVLLDCPPVGGITDSVVVSAYADATLLVCRAGATTHHRLGQAIDRLRLGGAPVAGIVLIGEEAVGQERSWAWRGGPARSGPTRAARLAGISVFVLLAWLAMGAGGALTAGSAAFAEGPCGALPCSSVPAGQGPCGAVPCSSVPAGQGPCGAVPCSSVPAGQGPCGAVPCSSVPPHGVPQQIAPATTSAGPQSGAPKPGPPASTAVGPGRAGPSGRASSPTSAARHTGGGVGRWLVRLVLVALLGPAVVWLVARRRSARSRG